MVDEEVKTRTERKETKKKRKEGTLCPVKNCEVVMVLQMNCDADNDKH